MRKTLIRSLLVLLFVPIGMWIVWLLALSQPAKIFILDKTVLSTEAVGHRSFDWILTYHKYTKADGSVYSSEKDYFGFFPKEQGKFEVKDLQSMTPAQLDSLSRWYDATYYADTYGVTMSEWSGRTPSPGQSNILYGGLQHNDLLFLEFMKRRKKMIIAEFNFFGSPTRDSSRSAAERMFGIHWTGWVGRYFDSFDTTGNIELPDWVVKSYKAQHAGAWPFMNSGIAFVHANGTVAILEQRTHLVYEAPFIETLAENQSRFNVAKSVEYPYWIEITTADSINTIVSYYFIYANAKGDSVLQHYEIPKTFPAVIERKAGYTFYYFAGNFADNPVQDFWVSRLRGVPAFRKILYNADDIGDRRKFFWEYYYPLMSRILESYFPVRVTIPEQQ